MEWNNNFNMKRVVGGKTIIIGEQDFSNSTVKIKEEDGTIINCNMQPDHKGDIYFVYCGWGVYISEYLADAEFKIKGA